MYGQAFMMGDHSQQEESPMLMMNKQLPCFNKKLLPQYQHPFSTDLFNMQQSASLDSYRTAADSGCFPLVRQCFEPQSGLENAVMDE
jgi:hypothetical protein